MRATIKVFQLIKEEERRAFLKYCYFKLKEEYPEGISEFNNDKKIKVGRADIAGIIFNKKLEFAEYLHEI